MIIVSPAESNGNTARDGNKQAAYDYIRNQFKEFSISGVRYRSPLHSLESERPVTIADAGSKRTSITRLFSRRNGHEGRLLRIDTNLAEGEKVQKNLAVNPMTPVALGGENGTVRFRSPRSAHLLSPSTKAALPLLRVDEEAVSRGQKKRQQSMGKT